MGDRSRRNVCRAQNSVLKNTNAAKVVIPNARGGWVCVHQNKNLHERAECLSACKKVVDEDMHLDNLFVGSKLETNNVSEEVECVRGMRLNEGEAVMICIKNSDGNDEMSDETSNEVEMESGNELNNDDNYVACLVTKKRAKTTPASNSDKIKTKIGVAKGKSEVAPSKKVNDKTIEVIKVPNAKNKTNLNTTNVINKTVNNVQNLDEKVVQEKGVKTPKNKQDEGATREARVQLRTPLQASDMAPGPKPRSHQPSLQFQSSSGCSTPCTAREQLFPLDPKDDTLGGHTDQPSLQRRSGHPFSQTKEKSSTPVSPTRAKPEATTPRTHVDLQCANQDQVQEIRREHLKENEIQKQSSKVNKVNEDPNGASNERGTYALGKEVAVLQSDSLVDGRGTYVPAIVAVNPNGEVELVPCRGSIQHSGLTAIMVY